MELKEGQPLEEGSPVKEEDVKKDDKSLEKDSLVKDVEMNEKVSLGKGNFLDKVKSLEKDKPLEKGKVPVHLTPAPRKVAVVDWRETLEVENEIPTANLVALEQLLQVAEVHIVSYVETVKRQRQLLQDVPAMTSSVVCTAAGLGRGRMARLTGAGT